MTGKQFINSLANGSEDVVGRVVRILESLNAPHCIVGGLAVNAYAEPMVSLDVDIVVQDAYLKDVCAAAESAGFAIEVFPNSVNLKMQGSDLRVQLQTDLRYQQFLVSAIQKGVLGYT
ncbi:MAG: hypothetical protein HUU46_16990 [Candidatus Hydrogenedentes bacterium]|nr:hypothetical protein [Candidatus Hydrogenedentota bacterium]